MKDEELPNLSPDEEIEFTREAAKALTGITGHYSDPDYENPRYERVRNEILFSDVVEELTGQSGYAIHCPFHGSDSRPSFYVYPPSRGNMGYCFGCSKSYTNVSFVAKLRGSSYSRAVVWLEKFAGLEPLDLEKIQGEEEENGPSGSFQLEFGDLAPSYIRTARRAVLETLDPELADEYLKIYFEAKKETSLELAVVPLAEVIGNQAVDQIRTKKLRGLNG